jgi:hypothetical protein
MANNTSLYTYVASPNVASNNFTTLYTGVQTVGVNTNYGNANVEAFLNAGTDGSNTVQNIVLSGNINVGGNSNLGNVGNVHITGGNLNYILETDGSGGLNWVPLPNFTTNTTSYIHFAVNSTANNQSFTNANLIVYANSNTMAVFKNGINIEPNLYAISGNVLTINILLNTGDTIDVLPSYSGAPNTTPGGNLTEVQYNGGSNTLSGNSTFTFTQGTSTLTVGNVHTSNILFNGNSKIYSDNTTLQLFPNNITQVTGIYMDNEDIAVYANSNVIIETNESGVHYDWTFQPDGYIKFPDGTYQNTAFTGGAGGIVAGSNTYVQYNNAGNFGASANFTFNSTTNTLTATNIIGNVATANYANFAGSATIATSATTAGNSNYANTANIANTANYANFSGTAFSISGANVSGIVANANYAAYAGNVSTANSANYANYANFAGTAYSIAGANVTGYVPNAVHSTISDSANSVAGANVSGSVTQSNYANIANSVAGANVSGSVSQSNYANIANSVAGANVSGSVANATNASFASVANSVAGANVTGYVANATHATIADTANSVATANYANYAGNIYGSNGSAYMTSLGQLYMTGGGANNWAYFASGYNVILGANYQYPTGPNKEWIFDTAGTLTMPGNITSTGTSNIANTNFTKFNETVISGGSVTGTITPNAAAGTIYQYTLTGNITFNSVSNAVAGTSMTIRLTQDGTGNRTLTSSMLFAGGSKTLSTAASSIDIISLYYDGTTYYAVLSKGYA